MRTCNVRLFIFNVVFVLLSLMAPAVINSSHALTNGINLKYRAVLEETGDFSCLSEKEVELVRLVNQYRIDHGLPPIANSRSLNKVARVHALDISENRPDECTDGVCEEKCSLHSWSDQGFWTPVCYTSDHRNADKMWSKTREITNHIYTGEGYENAYWTSESEVRVERVMECWKKSPSHNALLLENGVWKGSNLAAFGVGIYKNVAVIWVGNMADPLGSMASCDDFYNMLAGY